MEKNKPKENKPLEKQRMHCCIAIPVENGMLSSHFGHCEKFVIVHVDHGKVVDQEAYTPPEHVPGLYPKWLAGFKVTDVIAGGIGQRAIELFNQNQINVFAGAPVKSAKELVDDFIGNRLELKANYCDHDKSHGQGRCKR